MLGLSMTEVIIILGLALLLLGPDQLPSIAKALGKGMREIRKATDDLKSTFEQEMVRMDEPELPRPLQPVGPVDSKPEAAALPPDPASARAAARRAAAGLEAAPPLHLVPPQGAIARAEGDAPAATAPAGNAPAQASETPAASAEPPAVKDVP